MKPDPQLPALTRITGGPLRLPNKRNRPKHFSGILICPVKHEAPLPLSRQAVNCSKCQTWYKHKQNTMISSVDNVILFLDSHRKLFPSGMKFFWSWLKWKPSTQSLLKIHIKWMIQWEFWVVSCLSSLHQNKDSLNFTLDSVIKDLNVTPTYLKLAYSLGTRIVSHIITYV
jgi:hypothetical protein